MSDLKRILKNKPRESVFHTPEQMKKELAAYPQFREKLYCRGFLLTDAEIGMNLEDYPFYGNWHTEDIGNGYHLYFHGDTHAYWYRDKRDNAFFLVGNAYNPYTTQEREEDILAYLSEAFERGEDAYWDAESEVSGVFCTGIICDNGKLIMSTDCCGMQLVNHGVVNNHVYVSSHSKLVADIEGLERDKFITELVNDRFFQYWGTWLPGDLTAFAELKRMQPNCAMYYDPKTAKEEVIRYYPKHKIEEVKTEQEFQDIIHELGRVMHNNMELIAKKWPNGQAAISVTGGRDSMTALACSNGLYDQYRHFSYISNYDESVDAYAAEKICHYLGIDHTIYTIPDEGEIYDGIETFKKVMECNAGCIGVNNPNDLKKRMYFSANPPCQMEVKSWVNEMGRGWYWNKYNKKHFPKYPYAGYWRAMHKLYLKPSIIKQTDKAFAEYLKKYYSKEVFDRVSWLELFFWEFAWSGGEGVFLTSEHRTAYDITVPFNNRKYVETMLKAPLEKRKVEGIPDALIAYMEPRIVETGVTVHDVSHTSMRAFLVRVYLEIFSKVHIF